MLQALNGKRIMKARSAPTTLTEFTCETEPTTIHMKVATFSYPLTEYVESIGENQRLVTPLCSLKEVWVQHQTFGFDVSENYRTRPL